MESIFGHLVTQWGPWGIIAAFAVYIIYDHIKNRKKDNSGELEKKRNDERFEYLHTYLSGQFKDINVKFNDTHTMFSDVNDKFDDVKDRIDNINEKFDEKIDYFNEKMSKRIDSLESQLIEQPSNLIDLIQKHSQETLKDHNNLMVKQIKLAPQLHKSMENFLGTIGCDHMFIGSFHNGVTSLSGLPYYKFDLVAEKFNPVKVGRDTEFAHMYKDVDILRHNKLPMELIQNRRLHYIIDENKQSELSSIDDILYRRMCGRDIKQLAVNLLSDKDGTPMGFVGCVKYDYEKMNFSALQACAEQLENIYNS